MKKQILSLATLALIGLSTQANEIPYNYAELGFSSADLGQGIDGDGFKIASSYELTDNIYVLSDYGSYDLGESSDYSQFTLGLGYSYSLRPNLDLQLDGAFKSGDLDIAGTADDYDENGYEIGLGVRSLVQTNIELGARVEVVNLDGNDTFFELNGHYYFENGFAVGAEVSFGDDLDIYGIKARYKF